MEPGKPQRRTNIFDYWNSKKKVKLSEEPIRPPKPPIARLEDLPNELLYDVFGYLDVFHVYHAFYNLNLRLRNLLTDSTLPLKISVSSMSKSTFQRYHRHIIMPNKHRITSIHLSNPFVVDLIFSPVRIASHFTRLETLVFDGIKSKYLANIIRRLDTLPNLTSLTIAPIGYVSDQNRIYESILRLPVLKHCKMSLRERYSWNALSVSPAVTSRLEQLIIDHSCDLHHLEILLPHVPQLRRLTCHSLERTYNVQVRPFPAGLSVLTHASLSMPSVPFDQFEPLIENLFRQLLVLRISTSADDQYLNANRWQHSITSFMPQLRIFDLQHISRTHDDATVVRVTYEPILNQFSSLFWCERKWFFGYQFCAETHQNRIRFYSRNPYRRKQYTLGNSVRPKAHRYKERDDMATVNHVAIGDEEAMTNCDAYFRHATELTFSYSFRTSRPWLQSYLRRIMPLNQLTTLMIDCPNFSFQQLVNLLQATPNISTLRYCCQAISEDEAKSLQQTETFRSVANKNQITKVTITGMLSIESTKMLVALCPRIQYLTADQHGRQLEASFRFIISRCKVDLQQLCLICVKCTRKSSITALKALIGSEELLENYLIKQIGYDFYVWW